MIAVWDDHEVSNDTWMHGAENHQPATEGDFELRKVAALKAYHEWMPTRNAQPEIIYRSFAFGDLLALHMLDTRVIGRDKQLDYADYFTAQGLDAARFTSDMANPARQRSEEHTSELQSPCNLVCRLLLEKKNLTLFPRAR